MATRQHQLLGDHGKTDFPAMIPNRMPTGQSLKKVERLDQPVSDRSVEPGPTPKRQCAQAGPEELSERHRQEPVMGPDAQEVDHIIAEYEKADYNRRLQMYLQMPELGSVFDSINRNGSPTDLPSDVKLRGRSFAIQMGMALGSGLACRGLGR